MARKKKFTWNLDDDLKPDLAYLVKQSEQEFTEYAHKIYDKSESSESSENFPIEDLYHTSTEIQTEVKDDDILNFNELLEKAFAETMAQANQIFKNDIE